MSMSYQEKKTIVSTITGALVLAVYGINTFGKVQSGMMEITNMKAWAVQMLIFIGIGIVASIVIQIIFHILVSVSLAVKKTAQNSKCDSDEISKSIEVEMVEDEMDKLIQLKSMRISFAVAGIGFITALIWLVVNQSAALMLNILFVSFSLGSLLEGLTQIYYYKKGVRNG